MTVCGELRYSAWGETRYTSGTTPTDRQYTGQINDGDTGLYYYNARYYDPALHRFIQADTIVPDPNNPQSLNRYSYTRNNPVKYTDPTGHWEEEGGGGDNGYCNDVGKCPNDSSALTPLSYANNAYCQKVGMDACMRDLGIFTITGFMSSIAASEGAAFMGMMSFLGEICLANECLGEAGATKELGGDILLYRSMTPTVDENGNMIPMTGESARQLGVRVFQPTNNDIEVIGGMVAPAPKKGMSVAPNSPYNLPEHRRPPSVGGGTGRDPVWSLRVSQLPDTLRYVQDSSTDGTIQPAYPMPYKDYKNALESTQYLWELYPNQ